MYTPLRTSKIYQQIADQLEKQILSGELRTGDRLPTERELANQFNVSRTAVREAMKSLTQKGLVDMRPGRGTVVIDATSQAVRHSLDLMMRLGQVGKPESLANLVEVREILEPAIAAMAAERITETELQAMRAAVETMDANLDDAEAYIKADNDFHRALAISTRNEIIVAFSDSIVELLNELRKQIFRTAGGPGRGQQHHKLILEAVARGDVEAARKQMGEHLSQVRHDSSSDSIVSAATS